MPPSANGGGRSGAGNRLVPLRRFPTKGCIHASNNRVVVDRPYGGRACGSCLSHGPTTPRSDHRPAVGLGGRGRCRPAGAVTKVFATVVGQSLDAVLSRWTVYVLVASDIVGFALQQSALKTGVLAPAIASSNAVTLFGSVDFGATLFGERLSSGGTRLSPALIGLRVALVGIILLAGAQPPQASEGMPRIRSDPHGRQQ